MMGEIKTLVGNPTKKPMIISVDNLEEYPYHRERYDPIQEGFLKNQLNELMVNQFVHLLIYLRETVGFGDCMI